ncbi:hypothetical protein OHA25_26285 [Nonomuraea sp. NBC_00507]|uniref:hypothetical protein n=1 Tax=Nonomuraea sp. NBC_00507 TaxID=2976002 RepID=UPI002E1715CC
MISTSFAIVTIAGLILLSVLLVGGIIMMAMRRRDHGRASVIGIMGCVVLLVGTVFNIARGLVDEAVADLVGLAPALTISNTISLLFNLTGTALLIGAVVTRRNPQQPAPPQGPGRQPPQQQPEWGQPPFQQQPPGRQNPPNPPFNPWDTRPS